MAPARIRDYNRVITKFGFSHIPGTYKRIKRTTYNGIVKLPTVVIGVDPWCRGTRHYVIMVTVAATVHARNIGKRTRVCVHSYTSVCVLTTIIYPCIKSGIVVFR